MSMEALRWVRSCGAAPTARLVLYALADMANDHAEAWPSLAALKAATGLSERAIRSTLRDLETAGMLRTQQAEGRSSTYILVVGTPAPPAPHPGTTCPPAGNAPRHHVPPSPAAGAPPPRHVVPPTPAPPAPGSLIEAKEEASLKQGRRGARLPNDWLPSETDAEFAGRLRLDVPTVAAKFRDYWHAKPGAGGCKLDWSATWRNWCRTEAERRGGKPAPSQSKLEWMLQ